MKPAVSFCLLGCALLLSGCASISRGVTEAVLDRKVEDTRQCQIYGPPVQGVQTSLDAQQAGNSAHTTKILMVHGIGKHLPDYSNQLQEKLMQTLGLSVMSREIREIRLVDPTLPKENGKYSALLRISRHMTADKSKQLLFYELTWSPITDPERELIAFDSSDGFSYRRAGLNSTLKSFVNQTVPDLLIYTGNRRDAINNAVTQSVCWMFNGGWDDLPRDGEHHCSPKNNPHMAQTVAQDDFFFITHSLGSRITVDTIQNFEERFGTGPSVTHIDQVLKDKTMTVFMLANQLPLLQMGRDEPEVTNRASDYCGPHAPLADKRIFGKFEIVAFSDPNDILSYPIPIDFGAKHLDSRICPEIVNVSLNIAQVRDIFGATNFADPLTAHIGYQDDDRVIGLIADGFSRGRMAPIVSQRCKWTESIP